MIEIHPKTIAVMSEVAAWLKDNEPTVIESDYGEPDTYFVPLSNGLGVRLKEWELDVLSSPCEPPERLQIPDDTTELPF